MRRSRRARALARPAGGAPPRTPRGGEARRGSEAGRGDSRRSHVVESEEVVAGEGAERCHDDGDRDDTSEGDADDAAPEALPRPRITFATERRQTGRSRPLHSPAAPRRTAPARPRPGPCLRPAAAGRAEQGRRGIPGREQRAGGGHGRAGP